MQNQQPEVTNEKLMQEAFEKASNNQLEAALKRTPTERFEFMMALIRLNMDMKQAPVKHKKL